MIHKRPSWRSDTAIDMLNEDFHAPKVALLAFCVLISS